MADISQHQFIALLKKSNVIEAKKLQPWLDRSTKVESARKLAKSLVQEGLLTTWQAKFLLSGRYRLRIGNYFLLSRLRRDELGARYLAIHASLARKVELQIFSRDLTSDTQRWKDLIQKATLVAKLDHPALVHVYDIDHDDERYFLVVEHVTGQPLDLQKEIFTTPQIGKLILQCAEGIEFAHQNKVVHGTIDQADVLLTDKGTVKLQNLTVSPMRNLNNDQPEAQPVADYIALAALGAKLLEANPGADEGSGVDLAAIFATMETDGPASIEKIKQWVEITPDPADFDAEVTQSGACPIFPTAFRDESETEPAQASNSSIEPDEHEDGDARSSSASIVAAAKASRPFLIACAIGLMLFGGIVVFGLSRAYSNIMGERAEVVAVAKADKDLIAKKKAEYNAQEQKTLNARQAKQNPSADVSEKTPDPKNSKTSSNEPAEKPAKAKPQGKQNKNQQPNKGQPAKKQPDEVKTDKDQPGKGQVKPDKPKSKEAKPDAEKLDGTEPEPSKFMDIFGNRATETSMDAAEKSLGDAKPNEKVVAAKPAKVVPDKLQEIKGIGPALEKVLNAAGIKTYDQVIETKHGDLVKLLEKGGANTIAEERWQQMVAEAKPLAAVVAEKAANHFGKVPAMFGLPPIETSEAVELTKLLIPSNYLMTTELVCPDGVSSRRIFFQLNKSDSDDQTWVVSAKRTETSSKSTEIATFQKTHNALMFGWLPDAAKEKSSVYLKNCLLRLSTPDGRSRVSKLRKPIEVRSLRINENNLFDVLSVEIDALPDFDQVRIQLQGLNSGRKLEVIDPQITPESPALVALRDRESSGQFMALQVSGDRSGKAIKLAAGLSFNGTPIKTSNQLGEIINHFAANYAVTQRRLQPNPKDRDLIKQNNAAKGTVQRMEEYMEGIKWLVEGGGGVGQAIDFEISAEFEDGRVLLAKSNKNIVDTDNKKKK